MPDSETTQAPPAPLDAVVLRLRDLLEADTARVSSPLGPRMFLVIGHRRSTRDDPGHWEDADGNRMLDWEYVDEKVVASGETEEELIASAQEYQRLFGMTMADYLDSLV